MVGRVLFGWILICFWIEVGKFDVVWGLVCIVGVLVCFAVLRWEEEVF